MENKTKWIIGISVYVVGIVLMYTLFFRNIMGGSVAIALLGSLFWPITLLLLGFFGIKSLF